MGEDSQTANSSCEGAGRRGYEKIDCLIPVQCSVEPERFSDAELAVDSANTTANKEGNDGLTAQHYVQWLYVWLVGWLFSSSVGWLVGLVFVLGDVQVWRLLKMKNGGMFWPAIYMHGECHKVQEKHFENRF